MEREKPKETPEADETDKKHAQRIVAEELGEIACLDYDLLPRNVGIKGDERIFGDSPIIELGVDDPAAYLTENYDVFEKLSNRLESEVSPVTRVLIDITPKDAKPTYLTTKLPRTLEEEGREI